MHILIILIISTLFRCVFLPSSHLCAVSRMLCGNVPEGLIKPLFPPFFLPSYLSFCWLALIVQTPVLWERDKSLSFFFTSNLAQSQDVFLCVGLCTCPNWISYVALGLRTRTGNSTLRNLWDSAHFTWNQKRPHWAFPAHQRSSRLLRGNF